MSGAMRRIGEYLGLLEDTGYDDYDGEQYDIEETAAERDGRPAADRQERPVRRSASVADLNERRRSAPASAPAVGVVAELSRITTLHPRTYNEARSVGEQYRDGTPVIMNLSEMSDADAKRLVDFAAGLVLALRGSMDKVTHKVFLLSPPNIEVTAEDRRRLAEGGFLNRD